MAEPFVFHFRRGADGQPEQMYLADIDAACTLCGQPQMQRYYHATSLHRVTPEVVAELARAVPAKTDYECPNCGSPVGPDGCRRATLTWAFPDDAGLVRAFVAGDDVVWQFVRERRLDPQELPGWEPSEHDSPAFDELSEEVVDEELGRALDVKGLVREALRDWIKDPAGGLILRAAPGFYFAAAGPDTPLEEVVDEIGEEHGRPMVRVAFDASVPLDLPTHREPAEMAGQPKTWLPAELLARRAEVVALVDTTPIVDVVERAFSVANLSWALEDRVFVNITTPREAEYPRSLPVLSIARRAVYTGLTPGDAARLTAEEIVGTLLRVW